MKTTCSFLRLLILCLVSSRADAQMNLSGVWNNLAMMHEDWPDRWPGPEVGDYAGVPLNEAARLRADTWDASLITAPRISVPRPSVRLRAELRRHAHLGGARLRVAAVDRHSHAPLRLGNGAHHLDGRPAASSGLRAAHGHGLFHRQAGARHPDRDHHTPEGRLDPAQRSCPERQGDGDRALHPSWGSHDAGDDRQRSGVPHGTAHTQPRL